MGYEMSQRDARFTIRAENKASALAAIKALAAQPRHLMRVQMWVQKHELETAHYLEHAIEEWGWETIHDDETGGVIGISFAREKAGDEETLFAAIAPFVEAGSYIEMSGEDGHRWRWCFDGRVMTTKQARIVWEE